MSFDEEIKEYSIDELILIVETQHDLYSDEEMEKIKELIEEKEEEAKKTEEENQRKAKEKKEARLPKVIKCPKCDAPNDGKNDVCEFCGVKLKKGQYFKDCDDGENETSQSFGFRYVISFLIPLVGLIMGAIMVASDDEYKSHSGVWCIVLSVISGILAAVVVIIPYILLQLI